MAARRLWLAVVILAVLGATGLRAWVALRQPTDLRGDARVYHQLATQLLDEGYLGYGKDHDRSFRPPLYPVFLAGVLAVTGRSWIAPRLLQAGLAGVTVLLVALLGWRIGRPWAGALGALVLAGYGHAVRQSVAYYPECLVALLVTLHVYLGLARPRLGRTTVRGLLAGAIVHLQPGLAALVVLEAAWRLLRGRERGERIAALVLVGVTALTAVPWTLRNCRVHGRFVFVSTNGGFNLLKGNHPDATGGPPSEADSRAFQAIVRSVPEGLDEIERDRWFRRQATDWMRAHPVDALRALLGRLCHWLFPRYLLEPATRWPVTYGAIFPFLLLGVGALWRRDRRVLTLLGIAWLAAALPAVLLVYVSQRYREPVLPVLCLLAGAGAILLGERIRSLHHAPIR